MALCQYTWPQYVHRGENISTKTAPEKFTMIVPASDEYVRIRYKRFKDTITIIGNETNTFCHLRRSQWTVLRINLLKMLEKVT